MHSSLISLQLIGRFYDVPINIDSIINEYALVDEEPPLEEVI